ncbi:unnamed protein product [Soboliphyme baturini]|uniref:Endonuclease/exonuclease/phosphatase n=1 Tax=Soboliphyme baturini TaxID=241478 RepID=A0A183J166_9BILA|nr:unnamed protein product [Soboliphyme baturini]
MCGLYLQNGSSSFTKKSDPRKLNFCKVKLRVVCWNVRTLNGDGKQGYDTRTTVPYKLHILQLSETYQAMGIGGLKKDFSYVDGSRKSFQSEVDSRQIANALHYIRAERGANVAVDHLLVITKLLLRLARTVETSR